MFGSIVDPLKGWKDNEGVFQYQGLSYISKIIRSELISCNYNNLLVKHFGLNKTQKLIAKKYY